MPRYKTVRQLSEILTESEKEDNLDGFLEYYDKNAISMPEYQLTLTGIDEIKDFYGSS